MAIDDDVPAVPAVYRDPQADVLDLSSLIETVAQGMREAGIDVNRYTLFEVAATVKAEISPIQEGLSQVDSVLRELGAPEVEGAFYERLSSHLSWLRGISPDQLRSMQDDLDKTTPALVKLGIPEQQGDTKLHVAQRLDVLGEVVEASRASIESGQIVGQVSRALSDRQHQYIIAFLEQEIGPGMLYMQSALESLDRNRRVNHKTMVRKLLRANRRLEGMLRDNPHVTSREVVRALNLEPFLAEIRTEIQSLSLRIGSLGETIDDIAGKMHEPLGTHQQINIMLEEFLDRLGRLEESRQTETVGAFSGRGSSYSPPPTIVVPRKFDDYDIPPQRAPRRPPKPKRIRRGFARRLARPRRFIRRLLRITRNIVIVLFFTVVFAFVWQMFSYADSHGIGTQRSFQHVWQQWGDSLRTYYVDIAPGQPFPAAQEQQKPVAAPPATTQTSIPPSTPPPSTSPSGSTLPAGFTSQAQYRNAQVILRTSDHGCIVPKMDSLVRRYHIPTSWKRAHMCHYHLTPQFLANHSRYSAAFWRTHCLVRSSYDRYVHDNFNIPWVEIRTKHC